MTVHSPFARPIPAAAGVPVGASSGAMEIPLKLPKLWYITLGKRAAATEAEQGKKAREMRNNPAGCGV